MTRSSIITGILILALFGCQKQTSSGDDSKTTSVPPVAPTQTTPVKFEVRDFKLDTQNDSTSTTYKGRGTLYSKDDPVRSGNYMAWLQAKQSHKNDELWSTLVDIHDGIGTFETFDSVRGKQRQDKSEVKYAEWNVAGYIRLTNAQLVSNDSPQNISSSSPSPAPQFEIRDFRITEDDNKYFPSAKGRGTLVAKTDDLKTGRHIVWLESKRAHENDDRWLKAVELQDGLGGFDTHDFLWELRKKNKSVKYYDWRIFGYTKCQSGVVVTDSANEGKSATNLPVLELRDFITDESRDDTGLGSYLTGHATVVAKDPNTKQGSHAVWLRGKATHHNDERETFLVTLRDGLGTLTTHAYVPDSEKGSAKVKYMDWEVFCIAPMAQGAMSSGEPANRVPQTR